MILVSKTGPGEYDPGFSSQPPLAGEDQYPERPDTAPTSVNPADSHEQLR
jgi:hypothetical protein